MSLAFCTYFDQNYAVRAVAMYQSLRRHCPPLRMYMLCLDDEALRAVSKLQLPDVVLIPLTELEKADPELAAVKATRSNVEYYFTCTSCLSRHLMARYPAIEVLTYLDSDLYFYGSVAPLLAEFEGHSIGAMYHRFPEHGLTRQGRYNVGWLSWRRDEQGLRCLQEYRRQSIEWCYLREENGKYADQAYLDAWENYSRFHVFEHRGANVAPWNLGCYRLTYAGDALHVDGYSLVFFHFTKFRSLGRDWFDSNLWLSRHVSGRLRRALIEPYIAGLRVVALDLPMTGGALRHFHYRQGLGLLLRNCVRWLLGSLRGAYIHHPSKAWGVRPRK